MKDNFSFTNSEDKTIENIAENYPVLSDEEKERIFLMSERKYNTDNTNDINTGESVSGVEHYKRPRWHRTISIAAAALLVVAGIGGSYKYLSRQNDLMDEVSTMESKEKDEDTTAYVSEIDYNAYANEIIDRYENVVRLVYDGDGLNFKYDEISFNVEGYEDGSYTATFFEVDAEDFRSCQDIKDYALKVVTPEFFEENYSKYFADFSGLETITEDQCHEVEYADYNGKLISSNQGAALSDVPIYKKSTMTIVDITENSFAINIMNDKSARNFENNIENPEYVRINVVNKNGNWLIESITDGEVPPVNEENFLSDEEYKSIALDLTDKYALYAFELCWGNLSVDENDTISFHLYSNESPEWEGRDCVYYRVTDENFQSCADIENFRNSAYTETFLKYSNRYDCSSEILGFDKSSFANGSSVDFNEFGGDKKFIDYNGKLYSDSIPSDANGGHFDGEPVLIAKGNDGFVVSRNIKDSSDEEGLGSDSKFVIEKDGDTWKISGFNYVTPLDRRASYLMQQYYDILNAASSFENYLTDQVVEIDGVKYGKYHYSYGEHWGKSYPDFLTNTDDVREYMYGICTPEALDEMYPNLIGGNFGENGDTDAQLGKFINYNGELYIRIDENDFEVMNYEEDHPNYQWDLDDILRNTEIIEVDRTGCKLKTNYLKYNGEIFKTVYAEISFSDGENGDIITKFEIQ